MLLKGSLLTSAGHKKKQFMTHLQGGGKLYNHKKNKKNKSLLKS